jgi:hypothetical protein
LQADGAHERSSGGKLRSRRQLYRRSAGKKTSLGGGEAPQAPTDSPLVRLVRRYFPLAPSIVNLSVVY